MKILSIDIETSPNITYAYQTRNVFIGIDAIEEPSRMGCFAYQWISPGGDDGPMHFAHNFQQTEKGQEKLVTKARDLLTEADAVVGWHSKGFDVPVILGECMLVGITDPPPTVHIDLYALLRDRKLPSKKLDYVAKQILGVGKMQHEGMIELAVKAFFKKDKDAQHRMKLYNMTDVQRTTELYHYVQAGGYIKHPNVNLFSGKTHADTCSNCAGDNLQWRGTAKLITGVYPRFQCNDCGRWGRSNRRVDSVGVV